MIVRMVGIPECCGGTNGPANVSAILGSIASAVGILTAILVAIRYFRDRARRKNQDKDDGPPNSGGWVPAVIILTASGTVVRLTAVSHFVSLSVNELNPLVLGQVALLSAAVFEGVRSPRRRYDVEAAVASRITAEFEKIEAQMTQLLAAQLATTKDTPGILRGFGQASQVLAATAQHQMAEIEKLTKSIEELTVALNAQRDAIRVLATNQQSQ